jgi:hypothetical protein
MRAWSRSRRRNDTLLLIEKRGGNAAFFYAVVEALDPNDLDWRPWRRRGMIPSERDAGKNLRLKRPPLERPA